MAEELSDLIAPLIEGIVEVPLWSAFMDRLRLRLGADYVSIVFRPLPDGAPGNRLIHLYAGQAWPDEVNRRFRESLGGQDPMPYHDLAAGRVYALNELLTFGDPEHDRYRLQLLAPGGMEFMRMMRVEEAGGVSAWLTVSRAEGDFDAGDGALIAAIAPFWRAALASYVALERERVTASVANEAIRRLNFGWLTLDTCGRILESDAHAAAMLAASDMLRKGRDGRLAARDAGVSREIAQAIQALLSEAVGSPENPRPRAIVLSREPWLDMLLVPSSLRSGTTRPAPALVAYVHADNWTSADRCEQLEQMFDLIPSEARLALALTRGMSIAEAAGELGLTVESARTYSKRIYAKTGARGQADLVRFIHRSVLAIA
jgi:DNA-binding CsgD family transcriptional regulator